MKSHRFLVPAEHIRGDAIAFSSEQWHQLHAVLRLRAGDQVRVFDGMAAFDRVVDIVGTATGRVVGQQAQAAEPRTRLVVYPALLQRDKFEPVLQKLTEIGAVAIGPLLTARGVVREPPDEHRQTRWRAILREAAEQCGRGRVPELLAALPFSAAIDQAVLAGTVVLAYEAERKRTLQDALRKPPAAARLRSIREGEEGNPLDSRAGDAEDARTGHEDVSPSAPHVTPSGTPVEPNRGADAGVRPMVSVFVGPEGGFADEEVDYARRAGVQPITLGPRILRSETASPLLAALVLYELGDLSSADDDERP